MQKVACHKCKHAWQFEPPMGRRQECPQCGSDARVCLNCRFYTPSAYRECAESEADWVKEKTNGNFCGYFSPMGEASAADPAQSSKNQLDALFGGGKPTSSKAEDSLKSELDDFFKKKS